MFLNDVYGSRSAQAEVQSKTSNFICAIFQYHPPYWKMAAILVFSDITNGFLMPDLPRKYMISIQKKSLDVKIKHIFGVRVTHQG